MKARAAALLLVWVNLAGCLEVQSVLSPRADQAERIEVIWLLMLAICTLMFLLVLGFLVYAVWRTRGRTSPEPVNLDRHPDRRLQATLAGWVGLIFLGLTVLITTSFLVDRQLAHASIEDGLHVRVTSNQWWWKVEYLYTPHDQTIVTANELHLPVGRPVVIKLQSSDVIHSFWVPNLHGKQDLIPGRTNEIVITPRRAGVYRGQCAEFCGLQHAHMALDVTVESAEQFEAWRKRQLLVAPDPVGGKELEGVYVFESKACGTCHQIAGTNANGQIAPNLTHIASRRSIGAGTLPYGRGQLAAWIADPQGIKPGTTMPTVPVSNDELNALVAYLDTLK
jgi:cytochrome c oxidase subunit II